VAGALWLLACSPQSSTCASETGEARIEELIAAMTLEEKCAQLRRSPPGSAPRGVFNFRTPDNERLGVPGFLMADGPHGIRNFGSGTFYPLTIAMAATWDPAAMERLGGALGRETLAAGRNVLLAPAIDINWDPRNGRTGESLGEDPYLAALGAIALTKGMQSTGCIATIKHLHGNAREKMPNRKNADYTIDRRSLEELFGYPYRRAIQEADAWSVMSAHPLVNGVHCSQSEELLDTILRRTWGFRYFVVADWTSVYDAAPALRAGNEVVMGNAAFDDLEQRVRSGEIDERTVDEAVRRVLRAKFASGLMGGPRPRHTPAPEDAVLNRAAGLEVARKALVLLRNEERILPLGATTRRILVTGPNAARCVPGIAGSAFIDSDQGVSTVAALTAALPGVDVVYRPGCAVDGDDRSGFASVTEAAGDADVVVFVGGLDQTQEGERIDRVGGSVQLPAIQQACINALAGANPRLIVVLQGGSVCALRDCLPSIRGLLLAWHGGQDGGTAIAEALTGKLNPGGKLPLTVPRGDEQLRDWDRTDFRGSFRDGFGYRRYDSLGLEPAFPFGFGLSYTSFAIDRLEVREPAGSDRVEATVRVRVRNTGDAPGDEVVQVYLRREGEEVANAPRQLRGFERVTLAPGERRVLSFRLGAEELCRWSDEQGSLVVDAGRYQVQVGTSSRDLPLAGTFSVARSFRYDSISRTLQPLEDKGPKPTAGEVGMIDLSACAGIDPSGSTDSTAGFQAAITMARDLNRALYVPPGTYQVSDTLLGVQNSPGMCGSHKGIGTVQIIGATAGARRPLIRLRDRTAAFGDARAPRAVLEIRAMIAGGERERSACGFRHAVRGIDIDLGEGNPGAVGIRFDAAQDSFLEDVSIAAHDGFAGITGLPGRSMAAVNLEVTGGRFGIHLQDTSLGAVLAGVRLYDQSERALHTNATRALAVTGLEIRADAGPVIRLEGSRADQGHLALRDARIEIRSGGGPVIENAGSRFVSLRDVYVHGATHVQADRPLAGGGGWLRITDEVIAPAEVEPGVPVVALGECTATPPLSGEPSADLVSRHSWSTTPSFETAGVLIATRPPYQANPDDEVDDSAAIQAALDAFGGESAVYLPAGSYILSRPLRLHAGNTLMGVPGFRSVLRPDETWNREKPSWMIETDAVPGGRTIMMDLALDTPDGGIVGAVRWRAGTHSIVRRVRNFLAASRVEGPGQMYRIEAPGGGRWYGFADHANERGYPAKPPHPDFRKLLVVGTDGPLTFYGLNAERGGGAKDGAPQAPFVEIRDSAHVRILGWKSETEGTALRLSGVHSVDVTLLLANRNVAAPRHDPLVQIDAASRNVRLDGVYWPGNDGPLIDLGGTGAVSRSRFLSRASVRPAVRFDPREDDVVFYDPLTGGEAPESTPWRDNRGGSFGEAGWRMDASQGYLRLDLGPEGAPAEGELEVHVSGLDPESLARAVGADRKVHLINMFSNPCGDHHAEGGGTATDALWTIRMGTGEDGSARYGGDFKLLWASRGAKRTVGSDYHEQRLRVPEGWVWRAQDTCRLVVRWSQRQRTLEVRLNDHGLGRYPWSGDGDPLRYVFLGGAPDFRAWQGAVFSSVRVRRLR
jgi:beta-glucosidase